MLQPMYSRLMPTLSMWDYPPVAYKYIYVYIYIFFICPGYIHRESVGNPNWMMQPSRVTTMMENKRSYQKTELIQRLHLDEFSVLFSFRIVQLFI